MSLIIAVGTSIPEFMATNDYVFGRFQSSLALDLSKANYAASTNWRRIKSLLPIFPGRSFTLT
jgi:hypothetical protein